MWSLKEGKEQKITFEAQNFISPYILILFMLEGLLHKHLF